MVTLPQKIYTLQKNNKHYVRHAHIISFVSKQSAQNANKTIKGTVCEMNSAQFVQCLHTHHLSAYVCDSNECFEIHKTHLPHKDKVFLCYTSLYHKNC